MNNNTQKDKTNKTSIMYNFVIVLLILIIAASSCIGIFAWAKYTSATDGTATAQVAKWSFKLVDGVTQTTDVIDFAITRTDGYGKVVEGLLAPGTFGEFQIGIDARGTETILEYTIDVELENKPTYLKLYSDSEKTQEIPVTDNKFTVEGYMSLEDVKEIRAETIYWDWPYENGDDVTDTADSGKTMTMKISVTGYEVLEQSTSEEDETGTRLADVVSVGDYVNYDASSNGTYTFTSADCLTGTSISATISTDDVFYSDGPSQWRVLNVDKDTGTVELMSIEPTTPTVTLTGGDGFVNSENVLNNVGAIYGHGKGAMSGRSITLEDVEQHSSFDPNTCTNSHGYSYGDTIEYTSGVFYREIKDNNGNVVGYENTPTTATTDSPVTMTQTNYTYTAKNYFSNETAYNTIFRFSVNPSSNKLAYWLASRSTDVFNGATYYYTNIVNVGSVSVYGVFYSNGGDASYAYKVVPVVLLKTNIKTTGKDDKGVWQLKVD